MHVQVFSFFCQYLQDLQILVSVSCKQIHVFACNYQTCKNMPGLVFSCLGNCNQLFERTHLNMFLFANTKLDNTGLDMFLHVSSVCKQINFFAFTCKTCKCKSETCICKCGTFKPKSTETHLQNVFAHKYQTCKYQQFPFFRLILCLQANNCF